MQIKLVSTENGLYDFDVIDAGSISRVTVSETIKKGDTFNIYFGESSKEGGIWQGDNGVSGFLTRDLESSIKASNAYKQTFKLTKLVFVACRNANGEADLVPCEVQVTESQYQLGVHYVLAEAHAESEGYESPYLCFDSHEQRNIARQVSKLDCPVPFTLEDKAQEDGEQTECNLLFGWDGLSLQMKGYSDNATVDDKGIVAYLEHYEGSVILRAYADINREEPSDVIPLDGAKNECRIEI
jgi:hypothetical protein